ncbi:hypothetical protein [Aquimarina sp. AU58]|uniref:hypothetical protein n=1 Tax=Aquimarina sp. AU58 TaxID=1874112 RepID=UPI000D6DCE82|nr:hypothetical protein [Aquimarina sp. AU58]
MSIIYVDVKNDEDSTQIGDYRKQHLYNNIHSDVVAAYESNGARASAIKNGCTNHAEALFTFSGHGHFDYINDYGHTKIFDKDDNDLANYLDDKIVHLHACFAGDSLGPEMVSQGCKAFFGYNDYFKAPHEDDPDYDLISHFMQPDETLVIELNNGVTASAAANMAIIEYENAIDAIDNSSQNGNYHVFIRENRDAFCHPNRDPKYGDKSATILMAV